MTRLATLLASAVLTALVLAVSTQAAEPPCALIPKAACFGVEGLSASLSTTQAGDHPDLTFSFDIAKDPTSSPNSFGLKNAFAPTRDVRVELPPGLIGDPNALGKPEQCTAAELSMEDCPNGSQVGLTEVFGYELKTAFLEPTYMMRPPGGDVAARLGFIAGLVPAYVDLKLRSESDYGISAEIVDAPTVVKLIRTKTTTWGVPADEIHDTERCTPEEVFLTQCKASIARPPGSSQLPFLTNPTRCGAPLQITGCNKLPFGPDLEVEPTSHKAAAPTGLDVTIKLSASQGVKVLEPSQVRAVRITLPKGMSLNPGAADGLDTCSASQVHFEERLASACPDASKIADTEFDIPVLERKLKGAIYIREPEPGNPFRIWIVADDLGLHVKLPGQLHVDKQTGQIESIVIGTPKTEGIPQAPLREVKLELKSGFRAPLVTPPSCGTYKTEYEFVPWSGGPPAKGSTSMKIDEGCETGGFSPSLSAGSVDPTAGKHSPFVFTITRQDGEQNPQELNITLPEGFAATFAGIPRCEGVAAETGDCSAASRLGKVVAAVGAGPSPLWVPQGGKRPTAIYLSGPYEGAPTSIVAVVPRQAGPFDFGDEVVRSAVFVDPVTARATAKTDPLPQLIEGIPISYRVLNVQLDRPNFALNPTSCKEKAIEATVTSSEGATAHPSSPFEAVNCAKLGFKPRLSLRLLGDTHRGAHPSLRAVLKARPGDANIAGTSVALPHSEFLEQGHIKTLCTRVQFAAKKCPAGSIYGHAEAITPLLDERLSGPVYLRSSSHQLPDLVVALKGPDTLPIEVDLDGRVDSINGGIRNTFEVVPDAPVTEFKLNMQGGGKGLLVNSTNLCAQVNRATVKFTGQNGRKFTQHPELKASCGASKRKQVSRPRRR
jgi:hypothetical protein